MDKQILQDVTRHERIRLLKDNAEKCEELTYPRGLGDNEITGLKDDYTKDAIKLAIFEQKMKLLTKKNQR